MRPLYCPSNEADLVIVKSLLEAEDIFYFVHNEHFGSLEPGPRIALYNAKTVFVRDADLIRARELIANIEERAPDGRDEAMSRYTVADKVRMFFEVFLFFWIMPGSRKKVQ